MAIAGIDTVGPGVRVVGAAVGTQVAMQAQVLVNSHCDIHAGLHEQDDAGKGHAKRWNGACTVPQRARP
jgi:hypothetical protein